VVVRTATNREWLYHMRYFNLLKAYCSRAPTGLKLKYYTLCPHCIYLFCIYLRTNSYLCYLQHKLIGFYNRHGKFLMRGTDWVFTWSSLRVFFKWLMQLSSWGWAQSCSKHVEDSYKHIIKKLYVNLVTYRNDDVCVPNNTMSQSKRPQSW
jgi:hypothetical protein